MLWRAWWQQRISSILILKGSQGLSLTTKHCTMWLSGAHLLPPYTSNGAQYLSAPRGLCLWIVGEEQENNLAEHRDALCKDRHQIWNTKWQLPGWKGQRSALFKWRHSTRKTGLLNLIHLRGEKSEARTDSFLVFFLFIHVVLLQSPWWTGNPVLT